MYKTRFGMHLRACGDNPHAVDAAGRQVGQIRLAAIMICGMVGKLFGLWKGAENDLPVSCGGTNPVQL